MHGWCAARFSPCASGNSSKPPALSAAAAKRVIVRHLFPNLLPPLLIQATFGLAAAIIAEGSLSFLGLGVEPPTPSWGSMLNDGRQFLLVAPHLTTYPGLAIMITVFALNLVGDGLQERLTGTQPVKSFKRCAPFKGSNGSSRFRNL